MKKSRKPTQREKNRRILSAVKPPKVAMRFAGFGTYGPAGPARSLITGEVFDVSQPTADKCDIWRVLGADCPWNPTPGSRVVQHITSLAEARQLGLR